MVDICKKLIKEYLKRISLDVILKDDWILIEAFRRRYGNKINAEELVRELKKEYFDNDYKLFVETIKEIEEESMCVLPKKQLYYLASTVFAESLLGKPVPASLVFEILRCIGMENERTFPNRYHFLNKLEEKGFVKKITIINSKAEQLYCSTEEGKKIVNETDAFNKLIELKEKILNDNKVKKLIELYSKEEIKIKKDLPKLLLTSQVISENDNVVKVLLYGKEVANLSKKELEKIDSIAKDLGTFSQSDLRRLTSSRTKSQAYIVYAYNKGWIDVVGRASKGRDSFIFERKSEI